MAPKSGFLDTLLTSPSTERYRVGFSFLFLLGIWLVVGQLSSGMPNSMLLMAAAVIGGYMAIKGAAEYAPDALILEGLAPSAVDWAHALGARHGRSKARVERAMVEGGVPDPIVSYEGPVLQLAGLGDTVVPIDLSRKLKAWFEERGVDLAYKEVDVASHDLRVSQETMRVARDFLTDRGVMTAEQVLDPLSFRSNAISFQSGSRAVN